MATQIDLDTMSAEEKIQVMEEIWVSLCADEGADPSPSWHAAVLNERLAESENDDAGLIDWEEAKQRLANRAK